MEELKFVFETVLGRQKTGLRYHFASVPPEVALAYKLAGITRVIGNANHLPFRLALISDGNSGLFLIINQDSMKKLGITEGSTIRISLEPDPEPNEYPIAEELIEVLVQDEDAHKRFFGLTVGKQRSLATYVNTGKSIETRIKRALDLAYKLKTNSLYADRKTRD